MQLLAESMATRIHLSDALHLRNLLLDDLYIHLPTSLCNLMRLSPSVSFSRSGQKLLAIHRGQMMTGQSGRL